LNCDPLTIMRAKWTGIGVLVAVAVAAAGVIPAVAAGRHDDADRGKQAERQAEQRALRTAAEQKGRAKDKAKDKAGNKDRAGKGGRPGTRASAKGVNDDPGFVQVFDNNVENLPTAGLQCPGDWQDLVHYLKRAPLKPDLFVVQQISGRAQLDDYVGRLSSIVGERYEGVIADGSPKAMNSPCGAPKAHQTNAVIYRKARFTDLGLGSRTWVAQSQKGGKCANSPQARTQAVKVKLHDKVANKDLTVASVHWATASSGGPPCSVANSAETAREMTRDGYGGSLMIFGGDMNFSDVDGGRFRPWYRDLNGDLGGRHGFRDAGFAGCDGDKSCLADNWTNGAHRRIDFLFARKDSGLPRVTGFHTITFDEGDAADHADTGSDRGDRNYSDHRAVMARIHY
ncbi:MAG TPA: hypothetical protein VGP26_14960, partial [Actinophytocola sp.]|nr:hypothetical protein [Actinophytocola sp.]